MGAGWMLLVAPVMEEGQGGRGMVISCFRGEDEPLVGRRAGLLGWGGMV